MPGVKTKMGSALAAGAVGGMGKARAYGGKTSSKTSSSTGGAQGGLSDPLQDLTLRSDLLQPTVQANPVDAYAHIDQRMAQIVAIQNAPPASKKAKPEELPGLFDRFLGMLIRLDQAMMGDATQSFGMQVYGMASSSAGSPATKASKDAYLLPSFDYAAFMDLMGIILGSLPEGSSHRARLESMRDELDIKDPTNVSAWVLQMSDEIKEIKASSEGRETEGGDATKDASKQARTTKTFTIPLGPGEKDVTGTYWAFMVKAKGSDGYFYAVNHGNGKVFTLTTCEILDDLYKSKNIMGSKVFDTPPGGITYKYEGPTKFVEYLFD